MTSLSAAERAISLGALAARNVRTFVGRGAKIGAPVAALCGIIADLASTVARFSVYLLVAAFVVALCSGLIWFLQYRRRYLRAAADGVIQPEELAAAERTKWLGHCLRFRRRHGGGDGRIRRGRCLGGKDDRGVIASVVPGMDRVQEAIFRTEKKVDAIKEDTTAIRGDTARLVASVDKIAQRFDALASGGALIAGTEDAGGALSQRPHPGVEWQL